MSKNRIQFQPGYSLLELFTEYGTEEQCREALFKWKWPHGFICPNCGNKSFCTLKSRNVYQCNHCHHQTSLTSGTIFANTNLTLALVFSHSPDHPIQDWIICPGVKASGWCILQYRLEYEAENHASHERTR